MVSRLLLLCAAQVRDDAARTLRALSLPRASWGAGGPDPVAAAFLSDCDAATKFDVHVKSVLC